MATKISACFIVVFALVLCCYAVPMQKRDAEQSTVVSDANQAFDKLLEDLNKGIKQLAADGINFQGVMANISTKASEFGDQLQTLGKELKDKVEEAAKKQGITT